MATGKWDTEEQRERWEDALAQHRAASERWDRERDALENLTEGEAKRLLRSIYDALNPDPREGEPDGSDLDRAEDVRGLLWDATTVAPAGPVLDGGVR